MSDNPTNREGNDRDRKVRHDRLFDLLADQALFGLEPVEKFELDELLREFPEVRAEEMEATTAAVHAAHLAAEQAQADVDLSDLDQLPTHLQNRIVAFLDSGESDSPLSRRAQSLGQLQEEIHDTTPADSRKAPVELSRPGGTVPRERAHGKSGGRDKMRETIAWLCAAAALVIALITWIDRNSQGNNVAKAVPLTNAERMERLLESSDGARQIAWKVNDAAWVADGQDSVSGQVVWSDAKQEGYMTFQGLAPNDPTETCYQLWIFDESQDEKYPINGGVFLIDTSEQQTVIPIKAELFVEKPYLFAITVEKPEGVVVSDRSRLPLLASVEL